MNILIKTLIMVGMAASAFGQTSNGGGSGVTPAPGPVSPSGAAGGSLSGNYPNPTLVTAVDARTSAFAVPGSDQAGVITVNSSTYLNATIAQAGTGLFTAGWYVDISNIGTQKFTLTPTTSTINGQTSLVINPGMNVRVVSDGTNYQTVGPTYGISSPYSAGNSAQQIPVGYPPTGFQIASTTPTIDDIGSIQNFASLNGSGVETIGAIQVQGLPSGQTLVYQPYSNSGTGTAPYLLACLTSTQQVQTCGASATTGIVGIVYGEDNATYSAGAFTTGTATIGIIGTQGCLFDSGGATAGDWAIASATAGDCADSGSSTYPSSAQAIGKIANTLSGAGIAMVTIVQIPPVPVTNALNPQLKTVTTAGNCTSGASPAVCSSAASGSVAVPAGTNATLVVQTTAVTANSSILLTPDETLGTKLSVTCNSTLATAVLPAVVTARSANTSFTITISGTSATNPVCLNYLVIN